MLLFRAVIFFLTVFVFTSCAFSDISKRDESVEYSYNSIQIINQSLLKGEIDKEQAAIYKVYAIFAMDRLPPKFRSSLPIKGASHTLMKIRADFDSYSKNTQDEIKPYIFRPKD